MNTHKLFQKFNGVIRLTDSKREKLKTSRKALRDKIKKFSRKKVGKTGISSSRFFPVKN